MKLFKVALAEMPTPPHPDRCSEGLISELFSRESYKGFPEKTTKERRIVMFALVVLGFAFGVYIACAIGADQEEYRRDRERRGIREDD